MKKFIFNSIFIFWACCTIIEAKFRRSPENKNSFSKAHWISDGSPEIQTMGHFVACAANEGSGHYNVMWKDGGGINSGEHYWKIQFHSLDKDTIGGTFVGLTNEAKFKKGFELKGVLYGTGLSNGRKMFNDYFGPSIKTGDTIGILASFQDKKKLKVYFDHNGTPLGLAFNINASSLPDARPVVRFSGFGSATIKKEKELPSKRTRQQTHSNFVGIEGDWKIASESTILAGKRFQFDFDPSTTNKLPTMKLTAVSGNRFRVNLNVVNSIDFLIDKTPNSWTKTKIAEMQVGGVHDPLLGTMERNLKRLTDNPDTVTVSGDSLSLKKGKMEANFVRYDASPKTFNGNPFSD